MKRIVFKIAFVVIIAALAVSLAGCAGETAPSVVAPDVQDIPQQAPEQDLDATNADDGANIGGDETEGEAAAHTPDDDADEPGEPDTSSSNASFYFELDGYVINMGQNMDDVFVAVGDPLGYFVTPSCAFEGNDIVFAYPGVEIFTFPLDDYNLVHTISLRDDSVRTPEGLYIGIDFTRVLDILGDDYSHDSGMFTFSRGLTTLEFRVVDGTVMGITYGLILDEA